MDLRIRCWLPDSEGLGRDLHGAFERRGNAGAGAQGPVSLMESEQAKGAPWGELRESPAFHQGCSAGPHVASEVLRTWHRICVLEGALLGTPQG